jgi:putative transcriptional regulator
VKEPEFELLIESVKEAGQIMRGEIEPARTFQLKPEDVKAIRKKLEKSQSEFARMIGVSVSTLQNWEQGRRRPEGPARALLKVASENPSAVADALDPGQEHKPSLATGGWRHR